MNDTQIAWLIVGIVIATLGYYGRGYVAYALAYAEIFFMFVKQGEIKFVMKSKSLHRVVANVKGNTLLSENTPPGWIPTEMTLAKDEGTLIDIPEKVEGEEVKDKTDPNNRGYLIENFGIFWLGWPFIHTPLAYQFRWDKWEKKKDGPGYMVTPRNELVTSLFRHYPYPIKSEDTEIEGNIPYDIQTLVTMEAVHPARALFGTLPSGTWLEQAEGSVLAVIRKWASDKKIEELRHAQKNVETKEGGEKAGEATEKDPDFASVIEQINTGIVRRDKDGKAVLDSKGKEIPVHRGIVELFGMRVIAVNLVEIQLSDETLKEITVVEERAEREGKAAIKKAERGATARIAEANGEAQAVVIEATARATALKLRKEAAGDPPDGGARPVAGDPG